MHFELVNTPERRESINSLMDEILTKSRDAGHPINELTAAFMTSKYILYGLGDDPENPNMQMITSLANDILLLRATNVRHI